MKVGQTSAIHFTSQILASLLGFGVTLYLARLLGAGSLGTYSLVLSLTSWMMLLATMGTSEATKKRISEGEDQGTYLLAGVIIILVLLASVVCLSLLFGKQIQNYLGYSAVGVMLLILVVRVLLGVATSALDGLHLVHVSGALSPLRSGLRSIFQIAALFLGLGLMGVFSGYVAAYALVTCLGLWIVISNLHEMRVPSKRHFRDLFSFAKYSWISGVRSRSFNWTDITVMGFFVSSSLIGIYSAAWNIAQFLIIFGGSISSTIFPEMSRLSAEDELESVSSLFNDALSYAGLFIIPGIVGAAIIGDRLLRVYGAEFAKGQSVLIILIAACLLQSYQNQISTTLSAIDRPDIDFQINVLFTGLNIVLNVILIPLYGWIGAAVATALAITLSLSFGLWQLRKLLRFSLPYAQVGSQTLAALIMGGAVFSLRKVLERTVIGRHNAATITLVVLFGAVTYLTVLFLLSTEFRQTVRRNLPAAFSSTSNS